LGLAILKGIGIYLLIGICKGNYYEAIISCQRAVITAWRTHKGKSPSTCSQWQDIEHWCQIESHIVHVTMVWKVQLSAASSNLLTNYGNIDNALKLFHDMQEMEFHHGLIEHYGLNGSVPNIFLMAATFLYMYVQEALVRLNSTLDMMLHSDVVEYELVGLMCDLQGIEMVYNQEVDCSLHFTFKQWNPGGHLDLDMSTIVTSLSK
jgi:hypothetical protein